MDRFNVWVGALVARIENMKDESGQTFVEYALVLVRDRRRRLLTPGAVTGLSGHIATALGKVTTQLRLSISTAHGQGLPLRRRP